MYTGYLPNNPDMKDKICSLGMKLIELSLRNETHMADIAMNLSFMQDELIGLTKEAFTIHEKAL